MSCHNKEGQTVFFYVNRVFSADDYQLIVMDRGLAKTTLARRRQFSTGDTDRPKYSNLDPIGHHPRNISKFGLFVLSSHVHSCQPPISGLTDEKYQARERSNGAEGAGLYRQNSQA